jgi:hypothetical protein
MTAAPGTLLACAALSVALVATACHRKPKPVYEYGETVTTTSDDAPPTTLPPPASRGWEKRKSW